MLVIYGINFAKNKTKKIMYALPQLYGINLHTSKQICRELGLTPELRIQDLNEIQEFEIAKK